MWVRQCRCAHETSDHGAEVVVAVTDGRLDFGPWEQIFYGEFDAEEKRVLVRSSRVNRRVNLPLGDQITLQDFRLSTNIPGCPLRSSRSPRSAAPPTPCSSCETGAEPLSEGDGRPLPTNSSPCSPGSHTLLPASNRQCRKNHSCPAQREPASQPLRVPLGFGRLLGHKLRPHRQGLRIHRRADTPNSSTTATSKRSAGVTNRKRPGMDPA